MKKSQYFISLFLLAALLHCRAASEAADQLLFGASESVDKSPAGVTVTSTTGGYSVSENPALGTLEVTLKLDREPVKEVTLPISIDNKNLATVSPKSLTFSTSDWNKPQSIVISGINNYQVDGNRDTILVIGNAVSQDALYNNLITPNRPVTVIDDDTHSVVVSPRTGLRTKENLAATDRNATFTVVLGSAPSGTVTIASITSDDTTEGTVSPTNLTFTPSNFYIPQTVTITGVDDNVLDGNINYNIVLSNATSTDVADVYHNLAVPSVPVVNIDDELPGIVVTPTTLSFNEGAAVGAANRFTVVLTNPPVGNVTIPVAIASTPAAAATRATVSTALLTFTPANYNTPQTVTVTPTNNSVADGNISFVVELGISTGYGGENPPDVTVTVIDDDTPGVEVVQLNQSIVEHTLQSGYFRLRLNSQPTHDVTIPINDTYDPKNVGHRQGSASASSVTFTPMNWNTYQDVTVTPVNDDVADGDFQWIIELKNCTSTDPKYNGLTPTPNITVNESDNDVAGFNIVANNLMNLGTSNVLTAKSASAVTGFATDDSARLDPQLYSKWTIRLRSEPRATVNLTLSVNSTHNDGVLNTTSLTFTTTTWNTPQTVYVTGASNGANEGNLDYTVNVAVSGDDLYGNGTYGYRDATQVARPSFTIYSCDNDVANLIVGCRRSGSFATSEGGGTATFHLITQSAPGSNVSVGATSGNTNEGTISYSPAVITSGNWNSMEAAGTNRIEATGVNDITPTPDGNVTYSIVLGASTGGLSFAPPSMSIVNIDDDQVLEIGNVSGNTSEDGTTATFGVRLRIQPSSDVTFTIACKSGSTECASLNKSSLTFTNANWNTYQIVTVTGKDDSRADAAQPSCVSFGAITSSDAVFNEYQPPESCPLDNLDNDKLMFITTNDYNPNFNSGMTVADGFCGTDPAAPSNWGSATFKALIADTATRVATTTGTDATGQVAWILAANKDYYLKTGGSGPYTSKVFTTNANKLFTFGSLTTPFSASGGDTFWTGLNSDWTSSTNNCTNWTQNGNSGAPHLTNIGIGGATGTASINNGTSDCDVATTRKLICVQQ